MARESNTLKGYVKTANLYLTVLVTLAIGFLGGVLFSSYRSTSISPVAGQPPSPSSSANVPLTREQSQTLAALTKATRTTPDNIRAWTQLGHFYFDVGRIKEAIEAYQKSLSLDADRPDVWTDIGVMYRRDGNPVKAIESFDRALSINSRHEVAMFNKGVVLMHDLNDAKAALNAWEMLVQINPNAKAPNGQLVRTLVTELKKNSSI
jgi:cytochrome c-type biogenesis protein CcmH/NrfG